MTARECHSLTLLRWSRCGCNESASPPPRSTARSHLTVEGGLLPQANGSARVTLTHGGTEVLAAVKLELGPPDEGAPDVGTIECSVDCWGASAAQLRGRGGAEVNAELAASLNR